MNLNGNPLDWLNIHPAILPVDSQSGASSGLVVSLKGYSGCLVVLEKMAGVAGDDPVVTITQAQAIAGTGEKALQISKVRQKLHATTVPGVFTEVSQAAADTYVDATSAEKAGVITVDVKATDLDIDNGFDCIRLAIPDTGAGGAQRISAFYLLYGPKYGGAGQLSPLVD